MTTLQDTPTVGSLLRRKRGDATKASVYKRLNVSPQTYDAWEHELYVPGDEHAAALADYLEMRLEKVVMALYWDRIRGKSWFRGMGLLTHTIELAA